MKLTRCLLSILVVSVGILFPSPTSFAQPPKVVDSHGTRNFAIERLELTSEMRFEIKTMRLLRSGFALTFTKPIDEEIASDLKIYEIETYTYIYREQYGSQKSIRPRPRFRQDRELAKLLELAFY